MSITKEELAEVLKANIAVSKDRNGGVWDVLIKVGTSVSTAGILALAGLIASFNSDINTLTIQQQYANEQMKQLQVKLDKFTEKPNFTLEDFKAEMAPIAQKVDNHEDQLSGRSEWMDKINARMSKIEAELQYMNRTK